MRIAIVGSGLEGGTAAHATVARALAGPVPRVDPDRPRAADRCASPDRDSEVIGGVLADIR